MRFPMSQNRERKEFSLCHNVIIFLKTVLLINRIDFNRVIPQPYPRIRFWYPRIRAYPRIPKLTYPDIFSVRIPPPYNTYPEVFVQDTTQDTLQSMMMIFLVPVAIF